MNRKKKKIHIEFHFWTFMDYIFYIFIHTLYNIPTFCEAIARRGGGTIKTCGEKTITVTPCSYIIGQIIPRPVSSQDVHDLNNRYIIPS